MSPRPGTVASTWWASRRADVAVAWRPWLHPQTLGSVARVGAALAVVGWAIGMVAATATAEVEARTVAAIASSRTSGAAWTLLQVGRLASFLVVVAIGGAVALWARHRQGHWRLAQLLVVTGGVTLAVVGAVKFTTWRGRPDEAMFDALSTAYPSGHAARATAVIGLVAWLVARRRTHGVRVVVWAVAVMTIVVIGASRVYLGMHWPSDVAVGHLIGAGILAVVVAVVRARPELDPLPRTGANPVRG